MSTTNDALDVTTVAVDDDELALLDAWWRAANYLTVGQIYLRDNALLTEPLRAEHIKPRLLGHWGTSPGLSILYTHLNRLIRRTGQPTLYVAGPGHGGPAILANLWLEGSYSEIYPDITRDAAGMRRLFRQFSTPGGVPSHVSVPTPGSIHEGGELGYALVHAFGAAFDDPDLLVACVVGDGEAETASLEGSWKGVRFLNPERDGAVLPILHLNGYKISGPTVLGRSSDAEVRALLEAHGYEVHLVEGDDPATVHRTLAATLDTCHSRIRRIQTDARERGFSGRPEWPAIVLRTPKGWTGPESLHGVPIEGTFRSHQVPLHDVRSDPEQLSALEAWMRSYRPEDLFGPDGRPVGLLDELTPTAHLRMGAVPAANGGRLLVELDMPDITTLAVDVPAPGRVLHESTRVLGELCRDIFVRNEHEANFRLFCPDETNSNRLGAVFDVEDRCTVDPIDTLDDHLSPDGRVMEVLSENLCHGWLEGYLLTGRHGLFASYEAFAMVSASQTVQHLKWLEHARHLSWRSPIASLNILLTSTCWRNDHNGFSHQGPGLIDVVLSKKGEVTRLYLPLDVNCLLSVSEHCFRSRGYVNLMVIDKQPQLQWLDLDAARAHCSHGLGIWEWASTDGGEDPDIVMACAGDVPTLETMAAVDLLREGVPDLRVRVVNVVDLMRLFPADDHPHGLDPLTFRSIFTTDTDVIFAFHGYPRAIHQLVHGHNRPGRFHVRGFNEEGTTTTPFDMVVLNRMSRYQLAQEALRRARRTVPGAEELDLRCQQQLDRHATWIGAHTQDLPEVQDWVWTS